MVGGRVRVVGESGFMSCALLVFWVFFGVGGVAGGWGGVLGVFLGGGGGWFGWWSGVGRYIERRGRSGYSCCLVVWLYQLGRRRGFM